MLFLLNVSFVFGQNDTLGEIFTIVEKMPVFPGGDQARAKFIVQNLQFPQKYKGSGISGTVYVTFVVSKTGKVANAKVLRGVIEAPEYDEEAVRVVSVMPNWVPGEQNGNQVSVQYNMPIKFTSRKNEIKKDGEK